MKGPIMASKSNTRSVKQPAAPSAVAKAVFEATKPALAAVGGKIIGGNGVAQGAALAEKHYAAAVADSASWRDKFAEILAIGVGEANKAYRAGLNAMKKNNNEEGKTTGIAISRSAGVRMSECLTVAKAADRGLTMNTVVSMFNDKKIGTPKNPENIAHAWIVQAARAWNETHNAEGKEVESASSRARAGRARLDVTDKMKRYVLSTYAVADLPKLARLMAALAKRVKTEEQKAAELEKHEPKSPPKGIDRRAESRGVAEVVPMIEQAAKKIDPTPRRVKGKGKK